MRATVKLSDGQVRAAIAAYVALQTGGKAEAGGVALAKYADMGGERYSASAVVDLPEPKQLQGA